MSQVISDIRAYLAKVGLLNQPGAVLYSGASTLQPGPVYLLGLNPGGSEELTLADSLDRSSRENNSYLDEEWAPGGNPQPAGQSTLQRRVQDLCTSMGVDTRKVPASNLVFTRSTRLGEHAGFDQALALCKPVHEIIVNAVRPSFLMTFGSLEHFQKSADVYHVETRSALHGNWKANRGRAHFAGREVNFGNVPHMSLWASDKRPDVVKWAIEGLSA